MSRPPGPWIIPARSVNLPAKVFGQPDLRKQLTETLGMDLAVSSPETPQKFLIGEIDRWGAVVRSNNVRQD